MSPVSTTRDPGALRVLLVHMPMADPILPNLGMELLAEWLRLEGIACDVLYGTLLMPPTSSPGVMHGMVGHAAFTPLYFELDPEAFAAELHHALTDQSRAGADRDDLMQTIDALLMSADICLQRCVDAVPPHHYDVVAFSIIFDAQKVASAALAARLKAREPAIKVVFGGTGCDDSMANALLDLFPEVDAVVSGDADLTIAETCRYVAGAPWAGKARPSGYVDRRSVPGESHTSITNAELDRRPLPNYNSFISQRARSSYAASSDLTLLFEGSRGCWWGDKHHCRFCGIRTVREGYRERPTQSVLREIRTLQEIYQPRLLYATDAILSRQHLRQLLPELVSLRKGTLPDLRLFFEVKTNMTRIEVALLAAAGVVATQPGIESFSTHVLGNTAKGATAMRQLETLKWLCTYNIDVIYGLLVGTPAERVVDLEQQIALIESIHHLQPPTGVNPLALHRFSPYFEKPEDHGIFDVRPFQLQKLIYRADAALLTRLCYELDYDSKEKRDPRQQRARDRLQDALASWRAAYYGGVRLYMNATRDGFVVTRRTASAATVHSLKERASRILLELATAKAVGSLTKRTGLSASEVEATLDELKHEGFIVALDDLWLALPLPAGANALDDARPLLATLLAVDRSAPAGRSPTEDHDGVTTT